jgi:diadenosine tetraphosphate (Ap4A) HIT family hydrolase
MTHNFILDPRLQNDGTTVLDLNLCRVIFVNNALFPWIILVPMIPNTREIIDLKSTDQTTLMQEISLTSTVMKEIFSPYKLNIAALGNKVEQLHIHIIARNQDDTAWPDPIFGKGKTAYDKDTQAKYLGLLREKLSN